MPRPTAIADPAASESTIRDILSRLRAASDLDTAEVLASGLNTLSAAMIRFRGDTAFMPSDITALLDLWNILLSVSKVKPTKFDFAPKHKPGEVAYVDEPAERREP